MPMLSGMPPPSLSPSFGGVSSEMTRSSEPQLFSRRRNSISRVGYMKLYDMLALLFIHLKHVFFSFSFFFSLLFHVFAFLGNAFPGFVSWSISTLFFSSHFCISLKCFFNASLFSNLAGQCWIVQYIFCFLNIGEKRHVMELEICSLMVLSSFGWVYAIHLKVLNEYWKIYSNLRTS